MTYPQWFIDELNKEEDKERALIGDIKTSEKIEFLCPVHGVYFQRVGDKIEKSTGNKKRECPKCSKDKLAKRSRQSHNFPVWFLNKMTKNSYLRITNCEVKIGDELEFLCDKHGKFIRKYGHWCLNLSDEINICPRCSKAIASKASLESRMSKNPPYPGWFISLLSNEEDKELARRGELETHKKCVFLCDKHGEYTKWVYDVIERSTGVCKSRFCPKCYQGSYRSSIEMEIEDYIRSISDIEIDTNVRGYIGKKELDIYIPSIKLAIEVNGSYYHSTLGGSSDYLKDKHYHEEKFIECKRKGIHLISIYDVDWFNKQDRIKEYLKDLILPKEVIYARNLNVNIIDKNTANDFFMKYHLLGETNSPSKYYALKKNDRILSIMAFGNTRFGSDFDSELLRYCVLPNVKIIGGAQRLFKHFIDENDVNTILSYSDNDFFMGGVYEKLGFVGTLCDVPRYYWTKDGKKEVKREQSRLRRLSVEYPDLYKESENYGNREDFIMSSLGYMKVYRSGNYRWVWSRI